jgi:large conductance mechanosensitive channel
MLSGFKQFVLRGNVVDMAVGVVIGMAFATVVSAFTKDLLTPFIAALVGKPDFSAISFTVNGTVFALGDFINALVSRMRKAPTPADPTTKKCSQCLGTIPINARRCSLCGQPAGISAAA